ncbi:proline-rich protein 27-like [Macrosteles quadrilineatus]|uniref:proline-rich protein 27-like n=1 Tax=Macrosteles quadrilineatus TaxID=74068 RepID=UPI0023E3422A|nr:proline-rich protein 27-like [Macrosteles quadrilineatus]
MASPVLLFKTLLCLLLATTVALAADEESDNGQYNPDLYEKPYETPENEEPTEATEEASEPSEEAPAPEAPAAPAPLPEVVAASPPVSVAPFPYPLLYQYNPYVYSAPHFFRPALFPTGVL